MEAGKLYLWMPVGDGAAEVNVDGTVYRASGTVEDNYDNVMLALPDPVVTGVVVTPAFRCRGQRVNRAVFRARGGASQSAPGGDLGGLKTGTRAQPSTIPGFSRFPCTNPHEPSG